MGQKVHPVAVRLNQNRKFDASWYNENYLNTYKEELLIRKAIHFFFQILSQNIPNLFLGRIFLQQSHQKTLITIFLYKNLIRGKGKIDFLSNIQKKIKKTNNNNKKIIIPQLCLASLPQNFLVELANKEMRLIFYNQNF